MLAILQAYTDVALLRRGPQTLPRSSILLAMTLVLFVLLQSFPEPGVPFTFAQNMIITSLYAVMLSSVVWLLLQASGHAERLAQTLTAFFGAELIITPVKIALVLLLGDAVPPPVPGEPIESAHMLMFALEAWSYVVLSAILREALGISILQSIGVIMLQLILFVGAARLVLPIVIPSG